MKDVIIMQRVDWVFNNIFGTSNHLSRPFSYKQDEIVEYTLQILKQKYAETNNDLRAPKITTIKFERSDVFSDCDGDRVFNMEYSPKDECLKIQYRVDNDDIDIFKERLNLAESMAFLVLRFTPWYCNEVDKFFDRKPSFVEFNKKEDFLYFAKKILLLYAKTPSGAIVRGDNGLESEDKIIKKISEIYPDVGMTENDSELNRIFDSVFSNKDGANPYFRCETRIIEDFIKDKLGVGKYTILYSERDGWTTPRGNMDYFPTHAFITYTSTKNLLAFECKKNWDADGMKLNNLVSIIIGHELGHLLLRIFGISKNETMAFRFARLLLEMRELNYSEKRKNDDSYKKARNKWEKYIKTTLMVMGYDEKMMKDIYQQ